MCMGMPKRNDHPMNDRDELLGSTSAVEVGAHRFDLFFDLCREMLCFAGLDGYFKRVNPAFERNLGHSSDVLLSKPFVEFVHPDDRAATIQELAGLRRGRDTTMFENRYLCANGSYCWLEWSARAVAGDEVYAVARNITESREAREALQESEQRFRQLAETIREVFYVVKADCSQVLYVSPAFEDIWQQSSESLYADPKMWLQCIRGDRDRERVAELFGQLLDVGTYEAEYTIERKDGTCRRIWDRAFTVLDDDGSVIRVVGIAEDVTARREAEDRARQRESELAHVARLTTLGELASGIAHELNQPLSAISIQSESCRLALGVNRIERALEDLDAIALQTQRAGQIMRRLRHFVRRRDPITTAVDVNQVVTDVVRFVEYQTNANSIDIEIIQASVPRVSGDPIQLQQVVLNLVQNAIHAVSGTEHPEIVIEIDHAGKAVTIAVRDRGPGVTGEELERIFEPFYTTKSSGIGIGLPISQSIVEGHGGRLIAANRPCGGMEFRIELPEGPRQ